ncbi:hypothetical protein CCP1ISM_930001 [Azospirillaceae bacterium]
MKLLIVRGTKLEGVHANINVNDKDKIKVLEVEHYEKDHVSCPLQNVDLELLDNIEFWLNESFLDKNSENFGSEYEDMVSKNGTQIQYVEISKVINFKNNLIV